MFGKKKRVIEKFPYDPKKQEPVIRASICTGEKVAGFRDRDGGTLHEVTLIRDYEDMKAGPNDLLTGDLFQNRKIQA